MKRSYVLSVLTRTLFVIWILNAVGIFLYETTSFYPSGVLYVTAYEDLVPGEVKKRAFVNLGRVVENTVIQVDELLKPRGSENEVFVYPPKFGNLRPSIKSTKDVNVTYVWSLEEIIKSPYNYNILFCVLCRCSSKSAKLKGVLLEYTRFSPIPHLRYHFIDVPPCLAGITDAVALKSMGYATGVCWHIDTHDWDEVLSQYYSVNKTVQPREIRHGSLYIREVSDRSQLNKWEHAYRKGKIFLEAKEATLQLGVTPSNESWVIQTYFLVSSFNPLRAYMYEDGYVRHLNSKCIYEWNKRRFPGSSSKVEERYPPCGVGLPGSIESERLSSFDWLEEQLKKRGKSPQALWQNIERAVVSSLMLIEAKSPFKENNYDQYFQMFEASLHINENGTARLLDVERDPFRSLEYLKNSGFSYINDNILKDTINILSYANASQTILKKLDRFGSKVGYDFVPLGQEKDCVPLRDASHPDVCLTRKDVLYLLRLEMEAKNLGQYRRVYPCSACSHYTQLLKYIKKKFYGCSTTYCAAHTSRIHTFVTKYSESL